MKTTSSCGEIDRRLHPDFQEAIVGAIRGKRLELNQQRRDEIERHTHARKLPQQRDHAVVVLQRMQPNPGKDVLVRHQVFVIWLVHVPEKSNLRHRVDSV